MFQFSQSLQIDRPSAQVWPYLIAFEQVPLGEHGIVEVRQVTPGAPSVGTEIFARRIYGGRETRLAGRIVAFEDGRSASMSLRGGPLDDVIVAYGVEPIEDRRSVVTYRERKGASFDRSGSSTRSFPPSGAPKRARTSQNSGGELRAGIPPRSSATLSAAD